MASSQSFDFFNSVDSLTGGEDLFASTQSLKLEGKHAVRSTKRSNVRGTFNRLRISGEDRRIRASSMPVSKQPTQTNAFAFQNQESLLKYINLRRQPRRAPVIERSQAYIVRPEDLSEKGLMEWILVNQGSRMCQLKPQTLAIIQREDLDGSTFLQWRLDEMRMVGISSSQCKRINELQRRLLRTSQIPPSFSHHQSPSSTMSHGRKPNLFSLNAGLNIRASSRSPSRSPAEAARTRTASPKRKNEAVRNATLRSKRARATASNRASSAPPPSDFGLVEGNGLDFQIPGEVNNFGDRFVADLLSPDVKSHASDDSGFSIRAPPLDVERSSRVPVMASIVPRRPKSARRPRNSLSKGGDSARSYATTASTVTAPNVRSKSHTSLFRSTNYRMDQKDEEMKTPPIYKQEQSHKLNWSDDDKLMDVDLFGSKDLPPLFSDLPGGPTSNQDELDTPKPKEEKKSTVGDKSTVTAEIDEDFWSHLKADNNLENFLPLIDRDATPMKPEDLKLPVTLDISPASKFQLALTSPRNNFPKNAQKHMKYWTKHKIEPGMTLEYDRLLVDP